MAVLKTIGVGILFSCSFMYSMEMAPSWLATPIQSPGKGGSGSNNGTPQGTPSSKKGTPGNKRKVKYIPDDIHKLATSEETEVKATSQENEDAQEKTRLVLKKIRHLVLKKNVPVDLLSESGNPPLFLAVACNKPQTVKLLLELGANKDLVLNKIKEQPDNPHIFKELRDKLSLPAYKEVQALLAVHKKVHAKDIEKLKKESQEEQAKEDAERKRRIDERKRREAKNVADAVELYDPTLVRTMLVRDPDQDAFLPEAAQRTTQIVFVNALLKMQEGRNLQGEARVEHVRKGREILQNLTAFNPEFVRHREANGASHLHSAAASNMPEVVTALLDLDFDIDADDNSGKTPLYVALSLQHYDVADLLMARGASEQDPRNRDQRGQELPRTAELLRQRAEFRSQQEKARLELGRQSKRKMVSRIVPAMIGALVLYKLLTRKKIAEPQQQSARAA